MFLALVRRDSPQRIDLPAAMPSRRVDDVTNHSRAARQRHVLAATAARTGGSCAVDDGDA